MRDDGNTGIQLHYLLKDLHVLVSNKKIGHNTFEFKFLCLQMLFISMFHFSFIFFTSFQMQLLLGFFVCCCFLSFVETLTTGTYEQAQIMQTTDGNNILKSGFTEHIGTYKVLKQPDVCSYKHLSACHLNEINQENYHRFCFKDVCPQDEYFCLNGNSYTLHICGYMPMCRKSKI